MRRISNLLTPKLVAISVCGVVVVALVLVGVFRRLSSSRPREGREGSARVGAVAQLPGGRGWGVASVKVGNSIGAFVISDAYIVSISLVFDPEVVRVERLSDDDWELRVPETYKEDLSVYSFIGPLEEETPGPPKGLLMVSGPCDLEAVTSFSFRLRSDDTWVSIGDIYEKEWAR